MRFPQDARYEIAVLLVRREGLQSFLRQKLLERSATVWQELGWFCPYGRGDEEELMEQDMLPALFDVRDRGPAQADALGYLALREPGPLPLVAKESTELLVEEVHAVSMAKLRPDVNHTNSLYG